VPGTPLYLHVALLRLLLRLRLFVFGRSLLFVGYVIDVAVARSNLYFFFASMLPGLMVMLLLRLLPLVLLHCAEPEFAAASGSNTI